MKRALILGIGVIWSLGVQAESTCKLSEKTSFPLVLSYGAEPSSLADFQEQIQSLQKAGYQFHSLSEFQASLESGVSLPKQSVLLTFDNGYVDQMPLAQWLASQKIPAHFFIPTAWIGMPMQGRKHMNWKEVEALVKDPLFTLGSYSHERGILKTMSEKDIGREIFTSWMRLHQKFPNRTQIPALAYPFGSYDPLAAEVASRQFNFAFTAASDPLASEDFDAAIDPCYQMPRLSMLRSWMRPDRLVKKVAQFADQLSRYQVIALYRFQRDARRPASESESRPKRTFNRRNY